ncbi:MAG TPA: hypothetical protein VHX86_04890 [Tepidisphaeraceae bacterium]|jgi:hypothetical protein|nr:hypothetical protein [Tepidisphaeraceae bacterium]
MAIADTGISKVYYPEEYYETQKPRSLERSEMKLISDPYRESLSKWREIFNEFQSWLINPSLLANEEGSYPSRQTIIRAWKLADRIARGGIDAPVNIVTDGNMGISLEWRSGPLSRWFEVSANGYVEEIIIDNGHLRSRDRFNFD